MDIVASSDWEGDARNDQNHHSERPGGSSAVGRDRRSRRRSFGDDGYGKLAVSISGYKPVAIWLTGLLVCLTVIVRTEFNADLSAFLPRSPSPTQQVLVEQLRDGLVSRLILIGIEGAPQD